MAPDLFPDLYVEVVGNCCGKGGKSWSALLMRATCFRSALNVLCSALIFAVACARAFFPYLFSLHIFSSVAIMLPILFFSRSRNSFSRVSIMATRVRTMGDSQSLTFIVMLLFLQRMHIACS